MKYGNILLAAALFIHSFAACATNTSTSTSTSPSSTGYMPKDSISFIENCLDAGNCELSIFREIAKLYRPPKEEQAVSAYILSLKAMAEKEIWKHAISSEMDKIGNLMIRIPATGRYVGKDVKPIMLQSHTDMVLSYKHAKPGEDLRPYFKNGVELVETDGWLHSKDREKTIGADNGIGVAIALRYMLDPSLEHPELELMFTVQEEIGLIGAFQLEIPFKSERIICLDGMTLPPNTIVVGSQGGSTNYTTGAFKSEPEAKDSVQLKILISNLAGGHSGGDIFRDRMNAIVSFGHLLQDLSAKIPGVKLLQITAGDAAAINKIANNFLAVISVPAQGAPTNLADEITKALHDEVHSHKEENHKDYNLNVSYVPQAERLSEGLSAPLSQLLAQLIVNSPNGVIEKDPRYTYSVKTSSNLGAWSIKPENNQFQMNLGFMTRSYAFDSQNRIVNQIRSSWEDSLASYGTFSTRNAITIMPWFVPEDSPLRVKALSMPETFNKVYYVNGGLEPSAFLAKYPKLDIIALAPYMLEAHTVNERLNVESVPRVTAAIATLLSTLE